MAEMTSYDPGTPSWVDLGTSDIDAAAAFYSGLFGWEVSEAGPVEETGGYRMAMLREKPVAGLGPQMNPGPPYWTTYVTVEDADKTASIVTDAGGSVIVSPMDVMTVGRMAVFADPGGAAFAVWQPRDHVGAGIVNEPGSLCWNELASRDTAASAAFYRAVFGWEAVAQDMGGMPYTVFNLGERGVAGMYPSDGPLFWGVDFAVADCDASVAKATELGGTVTTPATDIPIGRFAVLTDPQGAAFSVIALND